MPLDASVDIEDSSTLKVQINSTNNYNYIEIENLVYNVDEISDSNFSLGLDIHHSTISESISLNRNSPESIFVTDIDISSSNNNLFVVGDSLGTLNDITINFNSSYVINSENRNLLIKLPDLNSNLIFDTVNYNDIEVVNQYGVSLQKTIEFISDKEIKIVKNGINWLNSDLVIIKNLPIVGMTDSDDLASNISLSIFSELSQYNPYYLQNNAYHDIDEMYTATGQPTVDLIDDITLIVNDTFKDLPMIYIAEDPNFKVTGSSFSLILPHGGTWNNENISWAYDNGNIELNSSIDLDNPNKLIVQLSDSLEVGSVLTLLGLQAGYFTNRYEGLLQDDLINNNHIQISVNETFTNYPYYNSAQSENDMIALHNIYVGQPTISINENHLFVKGDSINNLEFIAITNDIINNKSSLKQNDTRIILPSDFIWDIDNVQVQGGECPQVNQISIDSNILHLSFDSNNFSNCEGFILNNLSVSIPDYTMDSNIILSFNDELTATDSTAKTLQVGDPQISIEENFGYLVGDIPQYIDIYVKEDEFGASIEESDNLLIKINDFGAEIQSIDLNNCTSSNGACNKIQGFSVNNNIIFCDILEDFDKNDEFILTVGIDNFTSVTDPKSISLNASGHEYISNTTNNKLRIGQLDMPSGGTYYITDSSSYQDTLINNFSDFHIQGFGVDVIENNDLFTMTLGNEIQFSDFEQINFLDNNGNDISSNFSLYNSIPNDTLIIQYIGQNLSDPSIYMSNFIIQNLINEVPNGTLDIYPKGLSHRVYNDYEYLVGDPIFWIENPQNYNNNPRYLYELSSYSSTSQSLNDIKIYSRNTDIFAESCLRYNDCSIFINLENLPKKF